MLLLLRLSQPQVLKRRVRSPTVNVGDDHQLQCSYAREVNLIVFRLSRSLRRTEIPLLPYNFAKTLVVS